MAQVFKNTDVLVIGGGLAGCWAAIRAKNFSPRVILVDKAIVSRSGCSPWAYYLLAPPQEKDMSLWKRELVEKGDYLNNQDWIDILLREHAQRLKEMESWGAPFDKDRKGNLIVKAGRGHKSTGFVSSDAKPRMEVLKRKARELGVEIIERVMITDLLTSDGKLPTSGSVIGAIGFNTGTGDTVVIKSKSVINAAGPIHHGTNLTGDGTAMSFRAGAELMTMEFCTSPTCYFSDGKHLLGTLNVLFQSFGMKILNSKGERFMEKYDPVLKERTDWTTMAQSLAKESFEGRGPAILDLADTKREDIDYFARLHPGRMAPFIEAGLNLKNDRLQVVAQVKVNSGSGQGGIKIDIHGRTNLPGLYGAGSTCKNLVHGTYTVGGINLAWCCTTGYRSGEQAAKDSLITKDFPLNDKQVKALAHKVLSPLEQKNGIPISRVFEEMEKITEPALRSLFKRADRISGTIVDLETLEKEHLQSIRARDLHELTKAHEAKNIALLCRATFRSALEREESRHSHYRQDFPYRDDVNWLKWVIIKQNDNHDIKVSTEPVPFDKYQVRLEKRGLVPSKVKFD